MRYVLITRHPAESRKLADLLRPAGITLRPYPVLQVEDVHDQEGWNTVFDSLLAPVAAEHWLVLASPRAAQRLVDQAREHDAERLLRLPAAVVGSGTAEAAEAAGLAVAVVGPGYGAGLAAELTCRWSQPTTTIFACGHDRRRELPDGLEAAGHTVIPLELYRMRPTPPRELPPLGPSLEAVVLTSPRSARYYLEGVGGHPLPCQHWALGTTTQAAAAGMGIECLIPPEANMESLAEELCKI